MSRKVQWVLLRGLMRDARHWGNFPNKLQALLPDAELCLLDLPGNGSRYQEQSPASVPAMADWLRAELLRNGHQPPYRVFAMSLGAMVAVAWAQAHPEELEACVLSNTSLKTFSPIHHRLQPAAWPLLMRMAFTNPSPRRAEASILKLTSRHPQPPSLLDNWTNWRIAQPVSRRNALRQLWAAMRYAAPKQPPHSRLMLICSATDELVDSNCSHTLANAWQCPLAVHPNAGHDLPLDDPDWVAQQLLCYSEFLDAGKTGP